MHGGIEMSCLFRDPFTQLIELAIHGDCISSDSDIQDLKCESIAFDQLVSVEIRTRADSLGPGADIGVATPDRQVERCHGLLDAAEALFRNQPKIFRS
jgi:hypothetical protein